MADRICPWCQRSIRLNPMGLLYKHDNRNHSGWCKGSLMPSTPGSEVDLSGGSGA